MDSEFFVALDLIEKEKGISKNYMMEKIRAALVAAVKKDDPAAADGVVVEMDPVKQKVRIYIEKTVVEEIDNPALDLTVEEAREIDPKAQLGDKLAVEVQTDKFGRIAAQAGKQVIIQGIREAERGMIYEEFNSKEHEVLTGLVTRVEPRNGNVHIKISNGGSGATEAVMLAEERVPGEVIREGDHLRVYVVEVRRPLKGPQVMVSRTHPGLVKRLFELEVPEIFDGTVEIKNIAREAGTRTKIAVASNNPDVDPIGACVGPKGSRVGAVVEELRGEKMDIIAWSENPEKFVSAALAPAEVYSAVMLEDGRSCRVIVPDNQLSLAIGKEGKNARLAAKLTGCKIDIKPFSEMAEKSTIKIDVSKLDLKEAEEPAPEE